jgi:hypothetical protein
VQAEICILQRFTCCQPKAVKFNILPGSGILTNIVFCTQFAAWQNIENSSSCQAVEFHSGNVIWKHNLREFQVPGRSNEFCCSSWLKLENSTYWLAVKFSLRSQNFKNLLAGS